jgi:transcriptional regulator with XRE-family HTH domain
VPADPKKALMESVGRRVAELRTEAELTQAQMAEKLRMAVANYQRIEQGRQNLTLGTMAKIAKVLHVDVAQFFETPTTKKPKRGRPVSRE